MGLVGKIVKITSDNENYEMFRDKVLRITYASNSGQGYDESCYPEKLCNLECEDGEEFPFALYEYEFKILK